VLQPQAATAIESAQLLLGRTSQIPLILVPSDQSGNALYSLTSSVIP
jgi:hypothetical protein